VEISSSLLLDFFIRLCESSLYPVDSCFTTFKAIMHHSSFTSTDISFDYISLQGSKVVPLLNYVPRHEDVLGEWMYSSTHSETRHWLEVSGQLHGPAALSPGKERPVVPIREEAGYAPELVWKQW
jgi:hypothetical protein